MEDSGEVIQVQKSTNPQEALSARQTIRPAQARLEDQMDRVAGPIDVEQETHLLLA